MLAVFGASVLDRPKANLHTSNQRISSPISGNLRSFKTKRMIIYLFTDSIGIAPAETDEIIANSVWYNDVWKLTNGQMTWRRIRYVLHGHDYEARKNREEDRCKYLNKGHYEVAPCVNYMFYQHGSGLL
jgi:hypothetical protein